MGRVLGPHNPLANGPENRAASDARRTQDVPAPWTKPHAVLTLLVALLPALFLASFLDLPLYEDGLFWWVPRAHLLAEQGPRWIAAGELPLACLPESTLPPQWTGGLPDYGHPPLWFHYLALWLRLLGPEAWVIHLACIPVAGLLGWGALTLAHRLAGPWGAPLAAAVLLSPPLLGQLLRPDTDLPLLAVSLWALVALCDRRIVSFALLSALATWLKEPAVLLILPALVLALRERCRRLLAASAAAPAALVAWALIHHHLTGWALAGAEHLPASPAHYLRDLGTVLGLSFLGTGRWVIWALALAAALAALAKRSTRIPSAPPANRALLICTVFVASQLLVFAGLNFLGGRDAHDAYTHVRYLLPAIAVGSLVGLAIALRAAQISIDVVRLHPGRGAALLAAATVAASLPSARWLHHRGPESNLYALDQARAWQSAAAALDAHRPERGVLWVESHLYTALTRPYAGLVTASQAGLRPFGPTTRPEALEPGDMILHARYGEPLSRLGELMLEPVASFTSGSAWVKLDLVQAGRSAGAPPSAP